MKSKVEVSGNSVIKYNTSKFSEGFEWLTERLSVNHNRELRFYDWYGENEFKFLKVPKLLEKSREHISLERLFELPNASVDISSLKPALIEFMMVGRNKPFKLTDYISSPTQSIIRGLILNAKFLGVRVILNTLGHLFRLKLNRPNDLPVSLIHKDLKIDQNLIVTESGVYFIDFGSSVLTRDYFLTDIVELATDHVNLCVDFDIIREIVSSLELKCKKKYIQSQLYLLLLRRYMHFPKVDRENTAKMKNVKCFINDLNSLVKKY